MGADELYGKTYVREGSAAQKENARPLPSSGSTSPVSPLSQTTTISPLAPTSPTPTTPPLTTALQQNAHPASPASPVGPPGSTTSPLHPARVPNTLRRHNKSTKNLLIPSGAVTRGRLQKQDRMGYQEFVWFLISEEDKRHPTAIEYWFRCMDLDGDGYLSMYELEYFYEEQLQRMEALGIETLPFHDCLCQMLDMVRPEENDKISLRDLKKCRMTPIFFDTFFNLEKYLDHEQRDPFASHRAEEDGSEVSDWNRYAAEEYELLVAEEGGAEHQDDIPNPMDLSASI
ncbi:Serine/threonine-protein phosphatase 2A regulatory subunit B'' subunit alpha [Portunus trituberculatus]|uniref:Serine/threonine-protein phosphatase 2A regulatory subunit B'' subunit alpha n=1 Tax=Portunus trituberculatus TaxID=210409 RepID=A0A5B7D203_PORTR|nr:Serine/threonine-protein phosphatase 2A regulatory subunit B'' subunit alpha [Portunus trituberculatus]